MRDVKFRAWVKQSQQMILEVGVNPFHVTDLDRFHWNHDQVNLMQYTGFKDKNGIEVYEDDIVYFKGKYRQIKFFDKFGMFGLVGKSVYKNFTEDEPMGSGGSSTRYKPYVLNEYYQKRMEIKGNIYQNPELIK